MSLFAIQVEHMIIAVTIFSFVPFIWWIIENKLKKSPIKLKDFFSWIGLVKPVKKITKKRYMIFLLTMSLIFLILFYIIPAITLPRFISSAKFRGAGIAAIPAALLFSYVQTALAEEIFFRGFLLKIISKNFGFAVGNIMQALAFATFNCFLFFMSYSIIKAVFGGLTIFLAGLICGRLDFNKWKITILPSIFVYGTASFIAALLSIFNIM